jgi:DNA (cytosine-5)-methyltransferase 1
LLKKGFGENVVLPKYGFHLFAGSGGGILADNLLGITTVGAVEIEKYPREVLFARQKDGILPKFPIWDDIRTFRQDNPECREYIKRLKGIRRELAICGGFPCQDISSAGKGAGIEGERSGLWSEMARVIGEIRPRVVYVENSSMLTSRGIGRVLGDLAEMRYNARWIVLGADDTCGPHERKRIWIMAYTDEFDDNLSGYGTSQICR